MNSAANTPSLSHRRSVVDPDEYEDDYDNECEVPVLCKVHNSIENPMTPCNKRRGASTVASASCGGVEAGTPCVLPNFDNLSPEESKVKVYTLLIV